MTQTQGKLPFFKMNGCGNDFVVIDTREHSLSLTPQQFSAIASRKTGIGCDQILIIGPGKQDSDATMDVYNADGSKPDACGNGARCVALLLGNEQGDREIVLDAGARTLSCWTIDKNQICVDMGAPKWGAVAIPMSLPLEDGAIMDPDLFTPPLFPSADCAGAVNMGNPHGVFFFSRKKDLQNLDLEAIGPALEHHTVFPNRANISFAHIEAENLIVSRVWERGSGATLCCGTAACAVFAIAVRRALCAKNIQIHLPGGVLQMRKKENNEHILMTGHAALDFTGMFDLEEMRRIA